MNTKLGDLIRDAREAKGMVQEELAEAIEMTPGYIGQLERGAIDRPKSVTRRKLSKALGVSLVQIAVAVGEIDLDELNAEYTRIRNTPGVDAKMKVLGKLFVATPELFDAIESIVQDRIAESHQVQPQSTSRGPSNELMDRT